MAFELLTKAGRVTPYGFRCGYVDDSYGKGTRIEGRGMGYIARAEDGFNVLYLGPNLTKARKACQAYRKP
ncbi:hypothetical protein PQD73_gp003 [Stenotrophomonas phage Salva]|uniref:Uncharacterized protein n=1 Tax=Stenotrophomonas phage Salva TaxID=2801524 RepID=A0A7U3WJT4_9CAUD|nr:hypothetical protein PQD73_gp003 [Stenotrophomonas phage Salva]QQM18167.1 hypothetical protein CPT_Salva_003 [Stenotrophomonas phage Salva]